MPAARTGCAAVDLGKTRVRIRGYGTTLPLDAVGSGAPGMAEVGGPEAAVASITAVLATWPGASSGIACWSIGAAGVESAPTASAKFAHALSAALGGRVVLASDVVTAHVGAWGGAPGTLLVAGTGAVALRVDDSGTVTRSDGWGPWLGDDGGGRWIGQHGLQAALRAHDGRGPGTALEADAAAFCAGGIGALPRHIGGPEAAMRLAAFAPVVLARAAAGDGPALSIVREAAEALGATASSVRSEVGAVRLAGGLGGDALLRAELRTALARRGLDLEEPAGDALDGAALLATRTQLPHERLVIRV